MGENEAATQRAPTESPEIFSDTIGKFRRRIVNTPGEFIFADFANVVDAVEGASKFQRVVGERNSESVVHRKMLFGIGINHRDAMARGE